MKKLFLVLIISLELFAGSQMCGSGTVIRLLSDDNQGSRHQRFIIKQSSGRTLLIAHNIDLAPKIYSLQKGGLVKFCGEYETQKAVSFIGRIMTHKNVILVVG